MVLATEVREYIERVKTPQILLRGCREFHRIEPRDTAYLVSRDIISKAPDNENFAIEGSKLMIVTWNAVRFFKRPSKIRDQLGEHIRSAYRECKSDLSEFEKTGLKELNLDEVGGTIKRIFSAFSTKPSIECTGASKILHVLCPRVFMMWDRNIR